MREGWVEEEGRWREGGWEGGREGAEVQVVDGGGEAGGEGGLGRSREDWRAVVRLGAQVKAEGMRQQALGHTAVVVGVRRYGNSQAGLGPCGAGAKELGLEPGQVGEGGASAHWDVLVREEEAGRLLAVQWRRARWQTSRGRAGAAAVREGNGGGGGARHGRWAAWIGECVQRGAGEEGPGAGWWWCGWDEREADEE